MGSQKLWVNPNVTISTDTRKRATQLGLRPPEDIRLDNFWGKKEIYEKLRLLEFGKLERRKKGSGKGQMVNIEFKFAASAAMESRRIPFDGVRPLVDKARGIIDDVLSGKRKLSGRESDEMKLFTTSEWQALVGYSDLRAKNAGRNEFLQAMLRIDQGKLTDEIVGVAKDLWGPVTAAKIVVINNDKMAKTNKTDWLIEEKGDEVIRLRGALATLKERRRRASNLSRFLNALEEGQFTEEKQFMSKLRELGVTRAHTKYLGTRMRFVIQFALGENAKLENPSYEPNKRDSPKFVVGVKDWKGEAEAVMGLLREGASNAIETSLDLIRSQNLKLQQRPDETEEDEE